MLLVLRSLARSGVAGVGAWSRANGVAIAGLALFAGRGILPDILSIEAANLLFLCAPALMYTGFLQYGQRRVPRRRLLAWVAVLTGLLAVCHGVVDAPPLRIALSSLAHGVLYGAIARTLWRQGESHGPDYPRRFATWVAVVLCALHAARTLIYAAHVQASVSLFDNSALNVAFFAAGTLALPALTLGAVMMVNADIIGRATWAADHDHLTGAWSRRAFFALAEREVERVHRGGQPLSVLVFDVDHFKAINDNHGHACGDRVLADIVLRAETAIRSIDACARLGGEEFAVLLPDTGEATARVVAERLRAALDRGMDAGETGLVRYTVSIGLATLRTGEPLAGLLGRADAALYDAKAGGRNRVCAAAVGTGLAA